MKDAAVPGTVDPASLWGRSLVTENMDTNRNTCDSAVGQDFREILEVPVTFSYFHRSDFVMDGGDPTLWF
jgi:hypothetical protein